MKHNSIRLIACFCLAVLLLIGCATQEDTGPGAMGSNVWEEMPALNVGTLSYDKLEVLPWNSGRCEASSRNALAETELGYYFYHSGYLYYASKADLSNWMLVCNNPDCDHLDLNSCNGLIITTSIVIRDNRIYFQGSATQYGYLFPYKGKGRMVLHMAPDGTDKQLAYAIEGSALTSGAITGFLTSKQWLYYAEHLDQNGNTVRHFYRVTDAGTQELPLKTDFDGSAYIEFSRYGDEAFYCNIMGNSEFGCFRFVDDNLTEVDISGLDMENAYLSGNTLRTFRTNDGYYDIDLTTREEVFLEPAQLENSLAAIILPNCIIESTLFDSSMTEQDAHRMKLFDGEAWREVALPEELADSGSMYSLTVTSVNSDCVFLRLWGTLDDKDFCLCYHIPLNADELTAEYCGELVNPREGEDKE